MTTVLGCTLGISANTDTIRQAKGLGLGLGLGRYPRNKQTNKQDLYGKKPNAPRLGLIYYA